MTTSLFSQWSATVAADNNDLNDIPLDENLMKGPHVNGAFQEIMKQLKAGVATIATPAFTGASATLTYSDDGATIGPILNLYRLSTTPAASDITGAIDFLGRDSAANQQAYARIFSTIVDPTTTSEDGRLTLQTTVAGTVTTGLTIEGTQVSVAGTLELGHASDTTLSRVSAGVAAIEGDPIATMARANAFSVAQQFTTLELGHATDTTLSRVSAGVAAIEGDNIATIGRANVFTATQTVSAAAPILSLNETDAAADAKRWDWIGSGGSLVLRTVNDAVTAWSDLFLASGGVINFNAGDVTITHAADALTLSTGASTFFQFYAGGVTLADDTGAQTFGSTAHAAINIDGSILGTKSGSNALALSRTTNIGAVAAFYDDAVLAGTIDVNGATAAYTSVSDERIKENFHDFDSGAIVDAITMYGFNFLEAYGGNDGLGVKAQADANTMVPHFISQGNDKQPGEEGFRPWAADYSKLVPVLWREVQTLRARLAAAGL